LVQGKTALIITHRFTTAMRADLIYVIDDGRIVEVGTHDELLERGGRYARSWRDQVRAGTPLVANGSICRRLLDMSVFAYAPQCSRARSGGLFERHSLNVLSF